MSLFSRAVMWCGAAALMGAETARAAEPPEPGRGERAMARPWMVSEARLPTGFPPPGPVGEVVVKTYPQLRLARAAAGPDADGMFMTLFRHIERHEIAMTAPVVMEWAPREDGAGAQAVAPTPGSMAFLYREPTLGAAGADPADPRVVVEDAPDAVVVSVGLRGGYDEATVRRGLEQLRAWLAEHPEWRTAGPPRSLAYNSPFVPWFLKYSEVQMPVTRAPAP